MVHSPGKKNKNSLPIALSAILPLVKKEGELIEKSTFNNGVRALRDKFRRLY